MKIDHQLAEQWIAPNSRVLDLGCGNGELLHHLQTKLNVFGYGIEMDEDKMNAAIAKGVNVIEQDVDKGLANFADNSFDTVVMARALQALQHPDKALLDMLRVGKEVIVTFPNFAHWQNRLHLGFKGKMPVSDALPHEWYNTPNIHLSTFKDFENLCNKHNITILDHVAANEDKATQSIKNLSRNVSKKLQMLDKFGKLKHLSQKANQTIDDIIRQSPNLLADVAIYRVTI